ncbi:DUF397 domain-containing protein [Saccharopolyspora sp. 5N102]|uniref:DUF397 domain-containing protein n=1 Tax=Saccharopolyspora sp. 5N102 TaxID=3375155 RepID=UPI003796E13A
MADTGWFKSSYSSNDSDNCVEVRITAGDEWLKSSYSGGGNDHCVEVRLGRGVVGVRDSKDRGGPALWVGAAGWSSFVGRIKAGNFDTAR